MSVIKGNFGGPGGGGPQGGNPLDNVDLSHAKTLKCEQCGHINKEFQDAEITQQ